MADYSARRRMMVDTQIRVADVTEFPIIAAFLDIPREAFVPSDRIETAYMSENLPLNGEGRVLLEPRTFGKMLEALDLNNDMLVLDLGCGFGYSSAVIARIAEAVVAVEDDEDLAKEAQALLAEHHADNVVTHVGELTQGAPEHGPYDAIIIEGGIEEVPAPLLDQLKDGGRIACLFMEGRLGAVRVGYKIDGQMSWRFAFNAGAPVLPGFQKTTAFAL